MAGAAVAAARAPAAVALLASYPAILGRSAGATPLRGYRLRTRDGGEEYGLAARSLDLRGHVTEQTLVAPDTIVTDGLRLEAS
ncbi:hypothetical protein ACFWWM_21395 [Streptomyces sp. NPDC058682]|uniref:hypothetical protein n=1 Tax=unclassified Streptomyces TaxID=2593676 RepID=UPI002251704A|nr:hypothetical protein [Streptomyces sp. NBC_01214]MCX4802847.1 hypothetical protein [Streptomyces sp. NBC_01214]